MNVRNKKKNNLTESLSKVYCILIDYYPVKNKTRKRNILTHNHTRFSGEYREH